MQGSQETFKMILLTLFSALFISAVAAWFSIAGLVAIFPGAPVAVGLMGSALELGKLVVASWLYRFWKKTNVLMRTYFIVAVAVLSFITSIGIFGYLTRAYVEGTQGLGENSEQIALLDAQISIERDNVSMSRAALQQLDAAVNRLTDSTRVERAIQVRNSQRRERIELNTSIASSNSKIAELQTQRATLNVGQRKLETEVGPIKYVAQLVYGGDDATTIDKAVRLLILLLIFVFDPLAILLLVAANIALKKEPEPIVLETPPEEPPANPLQDEIQDNSTQMDTDWAPAAWFRMVTKPK